jgi:hypothetical protein
VLSLGVIRVLEAKPISVLNMVAEHDVLSLDVKMLLEKRLISVKHMVVEHGVQIVLLGQTHGVVQRIMTVTVQRVSSKSFQLMSEARLYIHIPKKYVFVMPLMRYLKGLFTINRFTLVNATVP